MQGFTKKQEGKIDNGNSSNSPLNTLQTFIGTYIDVSSYGSVVTACKTDQSGILYMEFSPDGSNWDSSLSFTVSANANEVHRITVTRRYYRTRFYNSSNSNQTYLRLQTTIGYQGALTSSLNTTVQSDADSLITRSVLMGQTDNGGWTYVPVTGEGHLEVAIHSPLNPFYSVHTESLTPVFQTDGVYSVNTGQILATSTLGGSVTASDSLLIASTGTTIYASGILQSRKRLRYRPGQGSICRFTAVYTSPVINSYQLAGIGHAEDGVFFGYGNTADLTDTRFGILYVNRGVREIKTLTLTTRATSAGNVTITLNGVSTVVALTNSTLQQNVWELSQAVYTGWESFPSGATIIFLKNSSGVTLGTQAFSASTTGSAATIVQTRAGVASTDLFIPQSTWNGDKLDGTGPSGVILNPQTLNVFQIKLQYLGAGAVTFQIESASIDGNNPVFTDIHTIKFPNSLTTSSFGNPSFPFTMAAYSAGSTTNLLIKTASYAGFIEGSKALQGNRFSYNLNGVVANITTFNTEFTIMNPWVYQGKSNQAIINILSISFAQQHNNVTTVYMIKNGALVGSPVFTSFSTQSMSLWDTASTSVTYTDGSQVVWSGQISGANSTIFSFSDEITIQPGEWISIAARSAGGAPTVFLTLNTREDQ